MARWGLLTDCELARCAARVPGVPAPLNKPSPSNSFRLLFVAISNKGWLRLSLALASAALLAAAQPRQVSDSDGVAWMELASCTRASPLYTWFASNGFQGVPALASRASRVRVCTGPLDATGPGSFGDPFPVECVTSVPNSFPILNLQQGESSMSSPPTPPHRCLYLRTLFIP